MKRGTGVLLVRDRARQETPGGHVIASVSPRGAESPHHLRALGSELWVEKRRRQPAMGAETLCSARLGRIHSVRSHEKGGVEMTSGLSCILQKGLKKY